MRSLLMKKTSLVMLSSLMVLVAACSDNEKVEEAAKEVVQEVKKEVVEEAKEVVAAKDTATDLSTDESKFSYAIGYQFARTLKDNDLIKDMDLDIAILAIKEIVNDVEKPSMTEQEVVEAITAFQARAQQEAVAKAEESAQKSVTFLEENKTKEGIVTTDSGLQYKIVTEGEGASPTDESEVEVHYKGTLINGDTFDSSYDRGQPATFPIGNVIPGFREGMMLMKEGGKSILYIPAALAYGKQAPPTIGPDQTLIFEVELLKVN